jgi:hypothetical protein
MQTRSIKNRAKRDVGHEAVLDEVASGAVEVTARIDAVSRIKETPEMA